MSMRFAAHACTLALLAMLPAGPAGALSTDKDQPVLVDSDNMELDFNTGVRKYLGNVVAKQGSLVIRGDTLVMKYDAKGELETATVYGKPATFVQRPDGQPEDVHGKAPRMIYNEKAATLHMYEGATINQGPNVMKSREMRYDINTSKLVGTGAPPAAKGGDAPASRGRTTIRIEPKKPVAPQGK